MKLTFLLSTSWHKSRKSPETVKCSHYSPQSKLCELTLFTNGDKVQAHDFNKTQENGLIKIRLGPVANLFSQSTRDI